MRYAQGTTVSADRSKSEVESILHRFGADAFAYAWKNGRAIIEFSARGKRIRFELVLPRNDSSEFTKTLARGSNRTPEAAHRLWDQACRQSWRALVLLVKAKLAAVDAGITSFETEFLGHLVIQNNNGKSQTMAEFVLNDDTSFRFLLPAGES